MELYNIIALAIISIGCLVVWTGAYKSYKEYKRDVAFKSETYVIAGEIISIIGLFILLCGNF